MKKILTLITLFISTITLAQDGDVELYQITPQWSLGDERIVHAESETITYINDTVYSSVKIVGDYKMTVVDTVDYYALKYAQQSDDFNIELSMNDEAIPDFLKQFLDRIESELAHVEYTLLIDKETGVAFEIENAEEIKSVTLKLVNIMINDLGKEHGKTDVEIQEVRKSIVPYFDSLTPQMNQTIINGVNYLLQAYTFGFPIDATYKQDMLVHDINAMGTFGTQEFPAVMMIEAEESGDDIIINTSMIYDKEFLLTQMKKHSPNMDHFTVDDVLISEKDQVTIDFNTTWIKKHVSAVVFQIPGVRVVENSTIVYR